MPSPLHPGLKHLQGIDDYRSSSMSVLPPAGWYEDAGTPGQERWWDGEQWSPSYIRIRPSSDQARVTPVSDADAIPSPRPAKRGWTRRVGLTLIGCACVLVAIGILMNQATSRHESQFGLRRAHTLPAVTSVPVRVLPSCGNAHLSGWVTSVSPSDSGDTLIVARGDAIEVGYIGDSSESTPYFSNGSITCDNGSADESGLSVAGGGSSSFGTEELVAVHEGSEFVVLPNGSAGPLVIVRIVIVGANHTSRTGETVLFVIAPFLFVLGLVIAFRRPKPKGGGALRRADDAQRQGSFDADGATRAAFDVFDTHVRP